MDMDIFMGMGIGISKGVDMFLCIDISRDMGGSMSIAISL